MRRQAAETFLCLHCGGDFRIASVTSETLLDPSLIEINSDGARACNRARSGLTSALRADRVKDCDLRKKAASFDVYAHLEPRLLRESNGRGCGVCSSCSGGVKRCGLHAKTR